MDLPRFLRKVHLNYEPPRAARFLLYIQGGTPVNCPDLDSARAAAENYAAEKPGRTVGVYELVGYAHRPIEKPAFQDTEPALRALLPAEPDSDFFTAVADEHVETDRPDLSPEQKATIQRMRAAMQVSDDDPVGGAKHG